MEAIKERIIEYEKGFEKGKDGRLPTPDEEYNSKLRESIELICQADKLGLLYKVKDVICRYYEP